MQPLVSICIPTYNRAELVQCAIASAQAQTYPNIEIIVTDNCSTDNTEEVVRAIAAKDPRIRYIRNETNVGPTRNWQIAVNAAKGEYCKLLYSDDEIAKDFISCCIAQFEKGRDVAFAMTDIITGRSFDQGKFVKTYCESPGITPSKDYIIHYLMRDGGIDSPSCALFRTRDVASKIVIENPFFEIDNSQRNGAGPDALIFLDSAASHTEIAYVAQPLTLFRESADSITMNASKKAESLRHLTSCYTRARYQFLREKSDPDKVLWYWRFLATCYIAVRNRSERKAMSCDLKLKGHHRLTFFDYAIGCVIRQYRQTYVKSRINSILTNLPAFSPR